MINFSTARTCVTSKVSFSYLILRAVLKGERERTNHKKCSRHAISTFFSHFSVPQGVPSCWEPIPSQSQKNLPPRLAPDTRRTSQGEIDLPTGLGSRAVPRLRESRLLTPSVRGAGNKFTQPRAHLLADSCTSPMDGPVSFSL